MSLYTRPFSTPLFSEFRPLLRLLNDPGLYAYTDADSSSEQGDSSSQQSSARRAFSPNFDVHETEHAYVLEGELPGLSEQDKKNLEIEFTDQNTLLIRGKIERSHQSGTPPSQQKEQSKESRKAHVEDESAESQQQVTKTDDKSKEVGQAAQPLRYWVSERSIGSFQRSFTFPGLIDQDNVKAKLKDGVLTIEVPKREKPTGKKITVS
ncbi:HSP20-like chaperone [Ascobolus immersus RN42]|uniref:HSP20-like chaperone n=1 Tax=Ascobolus immersus RN42 TaxID=1160509 RepID=A0A3N4HS00_ASCIM|nr:HSP20-like chaperone [Ascobolus immersus RN42]